MNLAIKAINLIRDAFYKKVTMCAEVEKNLTNQDLQYILSLFDSLIIYINSKSFSNEKIAILNRRLDELEGDMVSYMKVYSVENEGADFEKILKNNDKRSNKQEQPYISKENKKNENTLVLGKRLEID